jgi:hypothetical protein
VALTPVEEVTGGRYYMEDNVVYTLSVPVKSKTATYFVYSSRFLSQKANITLRLEAFNLNLTANVGPTRIFYRICEYSANYDCSLNSTE